MSPWRTRRSAHRGTRLRGSLTVIVAVASLAGGAGCTDDPPAPIDPATYLAEINSICAASRTEQDALTAPSDDAGVETFSLTVADVLTREADAAREVRAPEQFDDDHRALVQNTADQASAWARLATTAPTDPAFGEIQTEILQLTLGRDDLANEMGLDACLTTSGSAAEPAATTTSTTTG